MSECAVPSDIQELLVPGETPVVAYENSSGPAVVFTNKRLITTKACGAYVGKDVLGLITLPWKSVYMWSKSNDDFREDFCVALRFHTRGSHHITFRLKKGIDVRKLDRIIAEYVL